MFDLDAELPAELGPLSWLVGVWEGSGVINFRAGDDDVRNHEFGQRVSFSHDGLAHLNYSSYSWLLDERRSPLASESGYWRLSRSSTEADPGPGLLPARGASPFPTAESVEKLRNDRDGFDIEVSMVHPSGVSELYVGQVKGPRIDLQTDAVMRSSSAKDYSAATRIYGLVEGHLLWAWDIAALGRELQSHASARLARVD